MKNKVNEIKVSYTGGIKSEFWQKINSSKDAAELLFEDWDKNTIALQESFKVVLLNNNNKVKGIYHISMGGITGTLVDIRILFGVVLKSLSVAIILCHNHPSGTLVASDSDKRLTQKIKEAAELFDIRVLDHLIMIPDGDFYSFADNGLL
ncbi:MAG: JAB domain-containing protein [Flavobacteriaceae bacterium]|nr:JAB domain-containing protein [Flavobacteriaceae bacterium]